ncbi:MAG TPA: hypothetical protein PKY60_15895, partial [Thermoflexales bacterium]|nr:hypothetical protein [Thermoflexales bacterium]
MSGQIWPLPRHLKVIGAAPLLKTQLKIKRLIHHERHHPRALAGFFEPLARHCPRAHPRLALAASHAVDPDFAWDGSVLATNSDLPPMIEEAKALSPGDL